MEGNVPLKEKIFLVVFCGFPKSIFAANNNYNYEILQVKSFKILYAQFKENPATICISITKYGITKWKCVYFLFVFHVPKSFREKEINDAKII